VRSRRNVAGRRRLALRLLLRLSAGALRFFVVDDGALRQPVGASAAERTGQRQLRLSNALQSGKASEAFRG
jgi:hypothetical protein